MNARGMRWNNQKSVVVKIILFTKSYEDVFVEMSVVEQFRKLCIMCAD